MKLAGSIESNSQLLTFKLFTQAVAESAARRGGREEEVAGDTRWLWCSLLVLPTWSNSTFSITFLYPWQSFFFSGAPHSKLWFPDSDWRWHAMSWRVCETQMLDFQRQSWKAAWQVAICAKNRSPGTLEFGWAWMRSSWEVFLGIPNFNLYILKLHMNMYSIGSWEK